MSDPTNPATSGARVRPSSVTIANYLLFLVALLLVVSAIAELTTMGTVAEVTKAANAGTSAEGSEALSTASIIGGAVFLVLLAVGLAVLGLLNNRGSNTSRIITWVIGGIVICCNGLGLLGGALLNSVNIPSTGDAPNPAELQRRINEELPGWYGPVTNGAAVLAALATLVALILLALPASNEFFRRRPAADPLTPGYPGYPTYPAYPTAPQPGVGYGPGTPSPPGSTPYPPTTPPGSDFPPATPPAPGTPPGSPPPGSPPPAGPGGASPTDPPAGPPGPPNPPSH